MINNRLTTISKFCKQYNEYLDIASSGAELTEEQINFLSCYNIELAKSIILDMHEPNAEQIANIILASIDFNK